MTVIKNYMEELVDLLIDNILMDLKICHCDQCKSDIKAIALNKLPPKYVVTKEGTAYTKTNMLVQQFEIDIITAVTKAAEMVNKSPRH